MLRSCDYAEPLSARSAHQIQLKYYGGNRSVSTEVIALEHFDSTYQETSSSSPHSCTRHAMFHSFLYDNKNLYVATTDQHSKQIIELL